MGPMTRLMPAWTFCGLILLLAGCGTLPNGRGWGEDVTLRPGFSQLVHAALQAAADPVTWLPAAGAVVFDAAKLDKHVSDWPRRKPPSSAPSPAQTGPAPS